MSVEGNWNKTDEDIVILYFANDKAVVKRLFSHSLISKVYIAEFTDDTGKFRTVQDIDLYRVRPRSAMLINHEKDLQDSLHP